MTEESAVESEFVEEPTEALVEEPAEALVEEPTELEELEEELESLEEEQSEVEPPKPKRVRVKATPKPKLVSAEPKRRGRPPGSRNRESAPAPHSYDPMEQLMTNMRQRRHAHQETISILPRLLTILGTKTPIVLSADTAGNS